MILRPSLLKVLIETSSGRQCKHYGIFILKKDVVYLNTICKIIKRKCDRPELVDLNPYSLIYPGRYYKLSKWDYM